MQQKTIQIFYKGTTYKLPYTINSTNSYNPVYEFYVHNSYSDLKQDLNDGIYFTIVQVGWGNRYFTHDILENNNHVKNLIATAITRQEKSLICSC